MKRNEIVQMTYATLVGTLGLLGTVVVFVAGSKRLAEKFVDVMDKFPHPEFEE